VVHFQGAGMPLLDQFFWKPLAKRLPMVLTVHDVKSHYDRFVSMDSFFRRSLHIPHCLIVHYENGKRQLVDRWDLPGDRVEVIPHGIMKPLYNPPDKIAARKKLDLPSDCRILLFFGNIRPNKGLDVLLEAMKDICAKNPKTLLVIAGALPRGMSFQRYSEIIERLDLSKNVRPVIEFVPDEDVDCFMSASDVVVLPYKEFESQSGVLLRAYAHKKPVVVTNVGAMGELVLEDKVGMVVEPETPDALAGAVIDVLNNPGEFQSGYTNGLEKKYDWKNIAELTIGAYEKAIAIKNRS
jgi:glycosyltransferase involved in cell wall biosynthesis